MDKFESALAAALMAALADPEPQPEIARSDPHDFDPDLRSNHVRNAAKAAKRSVSTKDPAECW